MCAHRSLDDREERSEIHKRGRRAAIAAVIGVVAAANVGGAIYLLKGGTIGHWKPVTSSSSSNSNTAAANAGPLTGVFRAAFGAEFDLDGTPLDDTPVTGTYDMRSVCGRKPIATADIACSTP